MIHCVGDSHVSVFSGRGVRQDPSVGEKMDIMVPCWPIPSDDRLPEFRTHRIGGLTSYQLVKKGDLIKSIFDSLGLQDGDWVLLAFGEIDCRVHLAKRARQGEPIAPIVEECVDRYGQALAAYKEWWPKLVVHGPIASSIQKETTEEEWDPSKNFPAYGTCILRNRITLAYTGTLSDKCDELGISFYSIMPQMIDEFLETDPYYLMDDIHLSQNAMPLIRAELSKLGVL